MKNGPSASARVLSHGVAGLGTWPVLPSQSTVIKLELECSAQYDESDLMGTINGNGVVDFCPNRICINGELENRLFSGFHFHETLVDDDGGYLHERCFGMDTTSINDYYLGTIARLQDMGVWPFVTCELKSLGIVLEIEYAAGIEPQTRYWVTIDGVRSLLGYESGHFSLPGIMGCELRFLVDSASTSLERRLLCMFLPCCHAPGPDAIDQYLPLFDDLLVPGMDPRKALQKCLQARLVDPGIQWKLDKGLGLITNGKFSQRNPESMLCVLEKGGYSSIWNGLSRPAILG
jgi:hypothetical protein